MNKKLENIKKFNVSKPLKLDCGKTIKDFPIAFWDERLSTVAAEKALLEADINRKRRSEVIDHVAASYILQGALDRISNDKTV